MNLRIRPLRRRIRSCVALSVLPIGFLFAQAPQRPRILGIAHITFYAHDCGKSRAYYRDFLGLQEPYALKNTDGSPSELFFKINDRQYVQIVPEREAGTDRLIDVGLETEDAEALRIYLASKAAKVPDRVHRDEIGNAVFDLTDPAGHLIEITQYMPDGKTALTNGRYMGSSQLSARMEHVGFVVTDLDPEYKFYTEVLGFRDTYRGGRVGAPVLSWINLSVPDGTDYIELMLFKGMPDVKALGSQHHLDLQVTDLGQAIAALKVKPGYGAYHLGIDTHHIAPNHRRQTNSFDPDGTRTEIMEPETLDGKPAPTSPAPAP
jgi:catechol 2,3-dioxygenase-like lactoylglutathione lyase family enzyme